MINVINGQHDRDVNAKIALYRVLSVLYETNSRMLVTCDKQKLQGHGAVKDSVN